MLSEFNIRNLDEEEIRFIKSLQPGKGIYKNNYSYACYVSLYLYALPFCKGKRVLDAACGLGYGSALLAQSASRVTGIDINGDWVDYARSKFQDEHVTFHIMDATQTDFPDDHFDCVVSIETFEHIPKELAHPFLEEIKRILKPDGTFILSTPNQPIHTQITNTEDHVNEVDVDTLRAYMSDHFRQCEFAYQRKGVLDEMKTFYTIVKTDRFKIRHLIPRPLRNWMHRFLAKELTEDLDTLLPRLKIQEAESLDDVKQAVLQIVVCKP